MPRPGIQLNELLDRQIGTKEKWVEHTYGSWHRRQLAGERERSVLAGSTHVRAPVEIYRINNKSMVLKAVCPKRRACSCFCCCGFRRMDHGGLTPELSRPARCGSGRSETAKRARLERIVRPWIQSVHWRTLLH